MKTSVSEGLRKFFCIYRKEFDIVKYDCLIDKKRRMGYILYENNFLFI